MIAWRVALALVLAAAGGAARAQAQEFGRLFFTPEQRSTLDARRKARLPDKPASVTVESPTAKIDGYVMRRGGKSTVWLNGEAVPEGSQSESGVRVRPGGDPSRVSVTVGEDERQVNMKIGESLERW